MRISDTKSGISLPAWEASRASKFLVGVRAPADGRKGQFSDLTCAKPVGMKTVDICTRHSVRRYPQSLPRIAVYPVCPVSVVAPRPAGSSIRMVPAGGQVRAAEGGGKQLSEGERPLGRVDEERGTAG